jgi:hypothetical protein
MSFHHTNWLTDHSKVDDPVTLLFMKTIADKADKLTGLYSIDDVTLAKACRASLSSVLRHKKKFPPDEVKILVKGGSWQGHRREKSVYRVLNRDEEPASVTPVKLNGVAKNDPLQSATYPRQPDEYPRQIDTPIEYKEQKEAAAEHDQSSGSVSEPVMVPEKEEAAAADKNSLNGKGEQQADAESDGSEERVPSEREFHKAVIAKLGGNSLARVTKERLEAIQGEFPDQNVPDQYREALKKFDDVRVGRFVWWLMNEEKVLRNKEKTREEAKERLLAKPVTGAEATFAAPYKRTPAQPEPTTEFVTSIAKRLSLIKEQ